MVEVELNFDFVRGLFMCQRVFKEAWSSKSPNEIVIKTRLIIITKTQVQSIDQYCITFIHCYRKC